MTNRTTEILARRKVRFINDLNRAFALMGRPEQVTEASVLKIKKGTKLKLDMHPSKPAAALGQTKTIRMDDQTASVSHRGGEPIAMVWSSGRTAFHCMSREAFKYEDQIQAVINQTGGLLEDVLEKLRIEGKVFRENNTWYFVTSPSTVSWAGPGGYWREVSLADVEVVS